ncbi:MAG: hypothetical protein EB015_14575 [Methylocystaceae bacterium]|nr:hypothetical protein [Methylocystaceae bacterium]
MAQSTPVHGYHSRLSMAEAGQFLEKRQPQTRCLFKIYSKNIKFWFKIRKKRPTKLENDRSRDTKKYCP